MRATTSLRTPKLKEAALRCAMISYLTSPPPCPSPPSPPCSHLSPLSQPFPCRSGSNPALFALLTLLIIPVALLAGLGLWLLSRKRRPAIAKAPSSDRCAGAPTLASTAPITFAQLPYWEAVHVASPSPTPSYAMPSATMTSTMMESPMAYQVPNSAIGETVTPERGTPPAVLISG